MTDKRATCRRCSRPPRACYCHALPTDELRTASTSVLVLQHEREQRRRAAISSVPVLRLVLPGDVSVLSVPESCVSGDELLEAADGEADAVLVLFPDAQAKTLDQQLVKELLHAREGHEGRKRVLLVVIDGTWTEAKKIAFRNRERWEMAASEWRARGKRFEYVCLGGDSADEEGASSIYGALRREPMEGCVSTLEAVAGALRVLEPEETGEAVNEALLTAFRGMVSVQSSFQQRGKAETLQRHGGVSKEEARRAKQLAAESSQSNASSQETRHNDQLAPREFVFYTTRTDFRQRQELVQFGETITCTYDQARDRCSELNSGRKRGQRVALLPLDVFQQRIQAQNASDTADLSS